MPCGFKSTRHRTYNKPRYFRIKAVAQSSDIPSNDLDVSFQPIQALNHLHSCTSHTKFFPLDTLFPSNYISTTKYSLLTFFPKSLLLQFRRLANIYFLITAILQCFPLISPLNPFSAVSPFVLVISLSLLREAVEDYDRYKSDIESNRSLCNVLCNGVPMPHYWYDIQVGNLLLIKDEEPFPADLVLLACDSSLGVCYIETSSLDGEKGLKAKNTMKETETVKSTENLKEISEWELECPIPDPMIYQFQGTLHFKRDNRKVLLNQRQFLPRGARLKNSNWIIGVVVYTGFDTKVMRNSEKSKVKVSNIEKKTNKYLLLVLIFQLACCLTSAVGYMVWKSMNLDNHWYLDQDVEQTPLFEDGVLTFLTYFLLNNTMIPISLIVSLEFVKVAQAFFINQDEDLFSESSKKHCKPRTSAINEELGQVEYIFSDKTGTLTCNKMQFKSLIVGNSIYGSHRSLFPENITSRSSVSNFSKNNSMLINEHNKLGPPNMKSSLNLNNLNLKRHSTPLKRPKQAILKGGIVDERSNIIYEFNDSRLRKLIKSTAANSMEWEGFPLKFIDKGGNVVYEISNQRDLVHEMLQIMATCHECIIERKKESGYIHYQGQSPDEIAIVDAARHLGFKFLGNDQKTISLDILESSKELEVLHSFEFNSNRKRMSVIVRERNVLKLYMKGADSKIKERLDPSVKQMYLKSVEEKLDVLSKIGLRVLCFAMRVVSTDEYTLFVEKLKKIEDSINREAEILNLAEEIEMGCTLIGATGVEDKLQDKVPETIADLLSASDKLETAENVGKSCQLISPEMSVMRFAHTDLQECKKYMDECVDIYKLCVANNRKKALLIEGDALNILTSHHELREKFIHISKNCEAVICCRVTPKQKADVVRLIKGHLNKITLAIGDGANDVNMLQEADIGIGIYGQEGLRAVQASDFAIGEFQCLWKLLLVHGRWCYLRIAEIILYFFYKNMVMTLPQFYFSFFCGFSGQTVFDDWYITLYNLIFTCVPLLIKGVLDQDVDYRVRNEPTDKKRVFPKGQAPTSPTRERPLIRKYYHKLYYIGQSNSVFNRRNFLLWLLSAILHSLLLFFVCLFSFESGILSSDGLNSDMWSFSITAFTVVILVVTARLGLFTHAWTVVFLFSLTYLSVFLYVAYLFVSGKIETFLVYQSVIQTFAVFPTYAAIILVTGCAFAVDLFAIVLCQELSISMVSYFRILIKTKQDGQAEYFEQVIEKVDATSPRLTGKNQSNKGERMPRASIFFEALEIRKMKEEFMKKKQFHFINIVNVKSGEVASSHQYDVEKNEQNEEENVVFSEDVCIKRNSTLNACDKVIVG